MDTLFSDSFHAKSLPIPLGKSEKSVRKIGRATTRDSVVHSAPDTTPRERYEIERPVVRHASFDYDYGAIPIEIWEGTVESIEDDVMCCILVAKIDRSMDRHIVQIDLEFVSDQDKALVKPGAVFYLTISRIVRKSGVVEKQQNLRFRRDPLWTASQIRNLERQVDVLESKVKSFVRAE